MAEASHPVIDRIERALSRVEAAARGKAYQADRVASRHAALRERIAHAVASLDALIARENGGE